MIHDKLDLAGNGCSCVSSFVASSAVVTENSIRVTGRPFQKIDSHHDEWIQSETKQGILKALAVRS